jgi:hypothetical protein
LMNSSLRVTLQFEMQLKKITIQDSVQWISFKLALLWMTLIQLVSFLWILVTNRRFSRFVLYSKSWCFFF